MIQTPFFLSAPTHSDTEKRTRCKRTPHTHCRKEPNAYLSITLRQHKTFTSRGRSHKTASHKGPQTGRAHQVGNRPDHKRTPLSHLPSPLEPTIPSNDTSNSSAQRLPAFSQQHCVPPATLREQCPSTNLNVFSSNPAVGPNATHTKFTQHPNQSSLATSKLFSTLQLHQFVSLHRCLTF